MDRNGIRYAFGGDRDIAVWVLDLMVRQGHPPKALLLPEPASHRVALRSLCPDLESAHVLEGTAFREPEGVRLLRRLNLDYIVCVHFPYLVPKEVLDIPQVGVLNLHPALLPYNRGWHTATWAILDKTPFGATLHFMDEQLDAGDIVHQRALNVSPTETANMLYRRVKRLELAVFEEALPWLLGGSPPRSRQRVEEGTSHRRGDVRRPDVREIRADEAIRAGDLIDRLRALTTDRTEEAAILVRDGQRVRVQVRILPDTDVVPGR